MEINKTLREYIGKELSASKKSLEDDTQLIESGIIDSLGILKLIAFIEEKFGTQIQDEELVPENFQTVNDIVNLVTSKQTEKEKIG